MVKIMKEDRISDANKRLADEIANPVDRYLWILWTLVCLTFVVPTLHRATGAMLTNIFDKIPFVALSPERSSDNRGNVVQPQQQTQQQTQQRSTEEGSGATRTSTATAPQRNNSAYAPSRYDHVNFNVNWASQRRKDAARTIATRCLRHWDKALRVEEKHGIPADFILAIAARESSCDMTKNFLNGQPLNMRTTIVPKGYGPFRTWEASVDAAVGRKYFVGVNWNNPDAWAQRAERYNGLGYQYRGLISRYVWSGDVRYDRQGGKFIRDGVFSRNTIDQQLGVIPLIDMMRKMRGL
ncbi:hypothetical protein V6O07_21480 [Arthrospira platensis SPKY2]